ncbi:MAG: Glutathione transport system permease protein GsiC [Nitrosomonadaceae bacterium]|nr:Glutathione transport system permease protein GsiC [Nitrosomonadaceae bacterium]
MKQYIIRRLIQVIPIIFLVATTVFFLFKLIPGDPATVFSGEQASPETIARVREALGLDQPVSVQYWRYLKRLVQLDLGKSYISGINVIDEIRQRLPHTIRLAFFSTLFSTILGVSMGLLSARRRETALDYILTMIALLGISVPIFWAGLLLIFFFSVKLNILPIGGNNTWQHYVMPVLVLSSYSIAAILRITRASTLEVMGEDFVRTARAKGIREQMVLVRHVVRNALIPVVTVIGLQFGYMLGGSIITETIFAWPGMGRLLVIAVAQRDVMVVQGVLIVFATSFVMVNLFVDLAYSVFDPRISYS